MFDILNLYILTLIHIVTIIIAFIVAIGVFFQAKGTTQHKIMHFFMFY
jgi:hypothetical protein